MDFLDGKVFFFQLAVGSDSLCKKVLGEGVSLSEFEFELIEC